ncbi:MAG: NAD(P)-binding domain-containing protein [Actinomycetota bacterium]|nr:NAD(P)-binding domain-containing protein [Actinomycetota bacterium]
MKLREGGLEVLVERGFGEGAGHRDGDYGAAGAELVSREAAWGASKLVAKYKAPEPEEYAFFRPDMHLACFLHAEGNAALTAALCAAGTAAYSYELFRDADGGFPISVVNAEISGKLAVFYGAYHLQSHLGGSGVLLADVPGVRPPRVVVIGYGNAGGAAARTALALGAEVVVLGTHPERLRRFQGTVRSSVRARLSSPEAVAEEVPAADLVIGAVLISTHETPPVVPASVVARMRPGSVIVDVTCGYGPGYLPTFDRYTTHSEPMFERYGVLHCRLDGMPAAVPRTATAAFSPRIAPYLIGLARDVYDGVSYPTARSELVAVDGRVVHPEVIRVLVDSLPQPPLDGRVDATALIEA